MERERGIWGKGSKQRRKGRMGWEKKGFEAGGGEIDEEKGKKGRNRLKAGGR